VGSPVTWSITEAYAQALHPGVVTSTVA
jgi:hypothetical protein